MKFSCFIFFFSIWLKMQNQFLTKCTEITKSRGNPIWIGFSVIIARTWMLIWGLDLPAGAWNCLITVDMSGRAGPLVTLSTVRDLLGWPWAGTGHLCFLPHPLCQLPLQCCAYPCWSLGIIWIRQQPCRCFPLKKAYEEITKGRWYSWKQKVFVSSYGETHLERYD